MFQIGSLSFWLVDILWLECVVLKEMEEGDQDSDVVRNWIPKNHTCVLLSIYQPLGCPDLKFLGEGIGFPGTGSL